MGCIRNEGANLVLGAFTHFKGGVHVIEQLVEGVADRAHFGTRVGVTRLHAHRRGDGVFFQVQVRHIGRHRRDSLQRLHGTANNVGASHTGADHYGDGSEGHHNHENGEGLLHVGERNTDYLRVGSATSLRG